MPNILRYLIILIVCLNYSSNLNSQIEVKELIYGVFGLGFSSLSTHEIVGDTLIKNINFQIVDPPLWSSYFGTVSYIGFKDRKGYVYSGEIKDTFKIYDFNLAVGDTLEVQTFNPEWINVPESLEKYLITDLDTIQLNGTPHVRQKIDHLPGTHAWYGDYLIENLGSDFYFLPYSPLIEQFPQLCALVTTQNDTVYINNPECEKVVSTSINNSELAPQAFKVFPNPVHQIINIERIDPAYKSSPFRIIIYDSLGKRVHSDLLAIQLQVDLTHLPSGIYFLVLKEEKTGRIIETHKFRK